MYCRSIENFVLKEVFASQPSDEDMRNDKDILIRTQAIFKPTTHVRNQKALAKYVNMIARLINNKDRKKG